MKKKRKGWVKLIVVLLVLAVLGGGGYWIYQRNFAKEEGSAYVQSVAEIAGLGPVGMKAQYNGIVEAKDVIEINPSANMTVKECFVTTGSKVSEGDPLFRYDVDDLTLSHAQLLIDITGIENGLRTNREQLESLNKRLEKAKEKDKYGIELEIQTVELDIKKAEFDLKDKQQKAEEMQALIDASEVCSPVTGTVRSVRDDTQSDPFGYGGGSNAYISIIAGTDFCVKGTVNEQTIYTLYPGMPVLVRSRVDDTVYRGTIYRIDTDSTASDQPIYYDGGGDRASKYAFYVEPESIEGLMIGQHVLIDLNTADDASAALQLPSAFLMQEGGAFYVWAADATGHIEKRKIEVGAYDEAAEMYEILSGLSPKDRIAFPDDTVRAGMLATETQFADPNDAGLNGDMPGEWDESGNGGMVFDGAMIDDGTVFDGAMIDDGMVFDGAMIDDDAYGVDSADFGG